MNFQRSTWAQETLQLFEEYGESPHPDSTKEELQRNLEQNLSDLLADLAHLCDRSGLAMLSVLSKARAQYYEETDYEGGQFGRSFSLTRH